MGIRSYIKENLDRVLYDTVSLFVCFLTGVTLLYYSENTFWEFLYHFREGVVPLVCFFYIHEKLNNSNYVKAGIVVYLSKCIYEILLLCGLFTINESKHVFFGIMLVSVILLSLYVWDKSKS